MGAECPRPVSLSILGSSGLHFPVTLDNKGSPWEIFWDRTNAHSEAGPVSPPDLHGGNQRPFFLYTKKGQESSFLHGPW